jgi:hypothetical protein
MSSTLDKPLEASFQLEDGSGFGEDDTGEDMTPEARENLLEKFGLKTPAAHLLLEDVNGLDGSVEMLLFHAALRLVDVPDCVSGAAAIRAERQKGHDSIGRIQLPNDYGRCGAGELAAEAFLSLGPGLVKVQWERRASEMAQPAFELLTRLGCRTARDLLKINLERLGSLALVVRVLCFCSSAS